MATAYQVNIRVAAGSSFNQEFTLTNPDKSPRNITGCKFYANIAKHPQSIVARESTSTKPKYAFVPLTTRVVDGEGGVFALSLPAFITTKLEEGKYVYDCVIETPNGERSNAVSGLCFVDVSFGSRSGESLFDGGGASADGGITLDGGGA